MSKEPTSKEEAIERLRAQIQPENYVASLEKMRGTYLERAAELLGNRDLNAASSAIDERDVDMVNIQLDEALADLSWRVDAINERIEDFAQTKKDVTRPFERAPVPEVEEEMPDETEVKPSALTDEELVDEARRVMGPVNDQSPEEPINIDEAREAVAGTIEADPNEDA